MHKDIIHGAYIINKLRTTYPNMESQIITLSYSAMYASRITKNESFERYIPLTNGAIMDSHFMNQLYNKYLSLEDSQEWVISSWDKEYVYIGRDDIRAYIDRNHVDNKTNLSIGSSMILKFPLLELYRQPGFIVRNGKIKLQSGLLTRIYINIKSFHSGWILGSLSELLDNLCIPYYLKILAHPKMYLRCDSCVVYVATEDLLRVTDIILDSIERNNIKLMGRVPLMTMQLAKGIGIADEPSDILSDQMSYGQWVSSLFVTNSLNVDDPKVIAKKVEMEIIKLGRNPECPYLRSDRTSLY
ncbi:MAG: T3SS effector HopA1 family protein [Candidatus Pacebacteria bacterium]|nr:T3SS effector HopA1 family protein [Candidatus Paceibacterota bacterium]